LEKKNKREKYRNLLYDKERTKDWLVIDPVVVKNLVWSVFYKRWIRSEASSIKGIESKIKENEAKTKIIEKYKEALKGESDN